jgi:hypothetical protein
LKRALVFFGVNLLERDSMIQQYAIELFLKRRSVEGFLDQRRDRSVLLENLNEVRISKS